jgi:hypothetical protein
VALLLAILLGAGLIALFVGTLRPGPNTTVTGIVATIEQHQVCVSEEGEDRAALTSTTREISMASRSGTAW